MQQTGQNKLRKGLYSKLKNNNLYKWLLGPSCDEDGAIMWDIIFKKPLSTQKNAIIFCPVHIPSMALNVIVVEKKHKNTASRNCHGQKNIYIVSSKHRVNWQRLFFKRALHCKHWTRMEQDATFLIQEVENLYQTVSTAKSCTVRTATLQNKRTTESKVFKGFH